MQTKIDIQNADPVIEQNIRTLIGTMIDDYDKTHQQVLEITPEMLPLSMPNEKLVLKAIYDARELGLTPSKETIANLIAANDSMKEPLKYIEERIWPVRTDGGIGTRELSAFVMFWHQNTIQTIAIQKMQEINNYPTLDAKEKYQKASQLWNYAAPHRFDSEHYSEMEWFNDFYRRQAIRADRYAAGVASGPGLPWEAHKAFFSTMEWGEITSIMADTGYGKTTLLFPIAEYNAWALNLNADVHVISLETTTEVLERRQFSRHALVDYNMLKTGQIDLRKEPWSVGWQSFLKSVSERNNKSGGYLWFHYEPSRNFDTVVSSIRKYFEISHAMGRSSIFIIDYFQKFDWSSVHRQRTEAFEIIAERLAALCHGLNIRGECHMIIMAQENANTGEAYASSWLRKVSQLMFSLKRIDNDGGELMNVDEKNKPLKDAHNRPRFWYTKRDKYTDKATLEIAKGNDAVLGSIQLRFENAFYRVIQDLDQVKQLKKDKVL